MSGCIKTYRADPGEAGPVAAGLPATPGPVPGLLAHQGGSAPRGVALKAGDREDGLFDVLLLAGDEERLPLGHYAEEDVIAEWRRLGAASGLPLMIQHGDGQLECPYPQIGPLALGEIRIRRRHGLLAGRRPRFLVRRKTARLPLRPAIHREREIAGGRGA